jgi:FtsP/CotA-like multicopper oxidase with cupredoxin domain
VLAAVLASPASAQSWQVQCPSSTITHPAASNNAEPAYTGPTTLETGAGGYLVPTAKVNGAIKCQQVGGGDGYASMGDGAQIYLFGFGPLSGLANIATGKPGTLFPAEFNTVIANPTDLVPGYPGALADPSTAFNGAIGLIDNSVNYTFNLYDIFEGANAALAAPGGETDRTVTVVLNAESPFKVGDSVVIGQGPTGTDLNGYVGTFIVTRVGIANTLGLPASFGFQYELPASAPTGLGAVLSSADATASSVPAIDGRVDARQIMDVGVMNSNIPAPLMAIDEDDEYFLTLTNVGMIMRPDLFEQHTVHFHGYPNASSFYDGVPDASVAINIGGSFTYYYLAPDAGTYFWHCHISPPEHLQMGMVGQLYVRPRQNRVPAGTPLYDALQAQQGDLRTACNVADVLCSNPLPAVKTAAKGKTGGTVSTGGSGGYAYNDGDGSTYYDVEVPLQMHGFDPNFHFVGMTFNPEGFADMKDKYFLLNGRSYPDTVNPVALTTPSSDSTDHFSQPISALVTMTAGQRALLRISDLSVSEYHTLASLGIRMHVVGWNAKLLRDQAGNNLDYFTNSVTLAGGESADVILDSCLVRADSSDPSSTCKTPIQSGTYYLYTSNLDHLSNDAENFGGQMTVVQINN